METIFGDLNEAIDAPIVKIVRDPALVGPNGKHFVYDGFVIRTRCNLCETVTETGITWKETDALLKGKAVPDVQSVDDGWTFTARCPKCLKDTRIFLDHYELYTQRSIHRVSKTIRRRLMIRTALKELLKLGLQACTLRGPISVHSVPKLFRSAADIIERCIGDSHAD